ncbi:hypothetical protein GSI_10793 [Ganoderma sinense ZZ0214-1]|uniref:C3H1-type domain-containing protein n=1 Tax=Ganoderma sinense ZZ0214-1 TaxID=1077348 RepID=A0A2G8S1L4_9APHY|nr:hypothetical protein GSI_10793 [Ganoderma sinense ZZ0214-1]
MLQTRCGDLETDENARVRAAISMTLCEIATGEHASSPLECESFRSDSNHPYGKDLETGRKCVSALSRSAQYWSSYSGYLREVNTAKEAHKNTTREAINVLRYLIEREKRMEQTQEDSRSIVVAVLEQIQASSATLNVASAAVSGTLRRVLNEILEQFSAVILETEQRAVHAHTDTISRMDANISQALDGFSVAMDSLITDLQRTVVYHLGSAFSQIESGLQNIALLVEGSSSKFVALETAFGELHHATVLLVMDARQAGADVNAHLRTSHMVLEKQLAIAAISDDVASTMSELVIKAQAGMQDLNMTVAEIKDNLSKDAHDDWATAVWFWFQEAMLHVLQDETAGGHPSRLGRFSPHHSDVQILGADDVRSASTSTTPKPAHVVPTTIPTPISPSPTTGIATGADSMTVSSSVRIVDGLYIDRFSRQHALSIGGPSTAGPYFPPIHNESEKLLHGPLNYAPPQILVDDAHHLSPTTLLYQTSSPPSTPHVQLPLPLSMMPPPSTTDAGEASSSSVHCPARAAGEDTRPARRYDEVCRLYQTGQCLYGEKCYRTHTLELPVQVTALTSSSGTEKAKKPAPAPLPTHIGGVELCKLNLAGKCPRGDGCHYLHVHDVEHLVQPQSRSSSPGLSKTTEVKPAMADPSRVAGLPMEKSPSPPPIRQLPWTAAHAPSSEPPQRPYVTLPGDVCRMYFFKRQCVWSSCRYRHCSPEETQALREASLGTTYSEAQSEVSSPIELPVPAEQISPALEVTGDDEHESDYLRPSENGNAEDGGNVEEGSPRYLPPALHIMEHVQNLLPHRPSNTSKKRLKSRKKKDKERGVVDESGHEDGKDQVADVKEVPKIAGQVVAKEEKGKTKAKSKVKDPLKSDTGDVKDERSTGDPKVNEGGKALSGTKALGTTVKDAKGKEKGEKVKEKEKEKGKERETRRKQGKGKPSAEGASPTTELSVSQSSPSPAGPSAGETSRSARQPSQADLPHARPPGSSKHAAIAQTHDYAGDGGDTDVEEDSSSYYTPGSGTISAQSSWSSMGGGSSASTVQVNYCIDFVRGNCNRQYCRFSHDIPRSVLANAHVRGDVLRSWIFIHYRHSQTHCRLIQVP